MWPSWGLSAAPSDFIATYYPTQYFIIAVLFIALLPFLYSVSNYYSNDTMMMIITIIMMMMMIIIIITIITIIIITIII